MTEPSGEQIAAVVSKHLRVHGAPRDFAAERLARAIVGALTELYPAITLPGPARALRVGRDDVLAVRVDRRLSMQEHDDILGAVQHAFPDHRVVVFDQTELTVVRAVDRKDFGDAVVEIAADGTRTVTKADDTILVSPELLAEMEKLGNYVDNVFTLDAAGKYRYRYDGNFGPNALFERIHDTEAPA